MTECSDSRGSSDDLRGGLENYEPLMASDLGNSLLGAIPSDGEVARRAGREAIGLMAASFAFIAKLWLESSRLRPRAENQLLCT